MKFFLAFLLLFLSGEGFACDGCNISTGLVNADPVNYVSFKYRNAFYKGIETPFQRHTKEGGALSETYLSYELTAKYFAYNQFYLQTIISSKETDILSDDRNQTVGGIADPVLLIGYQDFEVFKSLQLNYNFFAGADFGIGAYNTSINQEYSPGSKSSDLLIGTEITARFSNWGLFGSYNHKIGFKNEEGYQFGQLINSGLIGAYYYKINNFLLMPFVSFNGEFNTEDLNRGKRVIYSSSNVIYGSIGLNILIKENIFFGGRYQIPILKETPGWETLSIKAFQLELSYIFGR